VKKIMAANWKMYKKRAEAAETAKALVRALEGCSLADREVLVLPPFTSLDVVARAFSGRPEFLLGAQDVYPAEEGAYTGEISSAMLLDAGCGYVLAGHSERRHVLGESNEFVGRKVSFALSSGLAVILCVGETLEEREAGRGEAVIEEHLSGGLAGISADVSPQMLSVAYEPVWAIGTGKVAQPEDILQAHEFIRMKLMEIFPKNGGMIRILYGGSVKPENAEKIIGLDNVNGVLVGGASLHAESFSRIVMA